MKKKKKEFKTVAVSGYFNPIHRGHIKMFREARQYGDKLVVIVNNDEQVKLKGTVPFHSEQERMFIVKNIRWVDEVVLSVDKDKTVCKSLLMLQPDVFANGGDRKSTKDIPEDRVCKRIGTEMVFNVGGGKVQSSSTLIKKAAIKSKKHKCEMCDY